MLLGFTHFIVFVLDRVVEVFRDANKFWSGAPRRRPGPRVRTHVADDLFPPRRTTATRRSIFSELANRLGKPGAPQNEPGQPVPKRAADGLFPPRKTSVTRENFLSGLKGRAYSHPHVVFLDACAERGDFGTLRDLWEEIAGRSDFPGVEPKLIESMKGDIRNAFALTPGYESAAMALRLNLEGAPNGPNMTSGGFCDTRLAMRLASAQTDAALEQILAEIEDLDMALILLNEALTRGKLSGGTAAGRGIVERAKRENHPLAWLPAELTELERGLFLPNFGANDSSCNSLPFGPMEDKHAIREGPRTGPLEFEEITDGERCGRMGTAFGIWLAESNGKIESRVFRLGRCEEEFGIILPWLGLACLEESWMTRIYTPVNPGEAFRVCFSAAAGNSAYTRQREAATGRRLAWRTMAALVGCSDEAGIEEISREAAGCRWAVFDAWSKWYYQVAWDVGIACINGERGEIAIMAVTDTD